MYFDDKRGGGTYVVRQKRKKEYYTKLELLNPLYLLILGPSALRAFRSNASARASTKVIFINP